MLTSKQRAYLRGIANDMPAIFQIGKNNLTPELTKSIEGALDTRELIKISVLDNCIQDTADIADILRERTHCEIIQVIGRKIILYRPNKKAKKPSKLMSDLEIILKSVPKK